MGGMTSCLWYFGSLRSFQEVGGAHPFSAKTLVLYIKPVATRPRPTAALSINLAAEAQLDRLVHRTVVDDGHVDLLVTLLGLQLGKRVRRVAGDVFDLD